MHPVMFVLMKPLSGSNMGHVESKTRSVGQIIEKPSEHNAGHIIHPVIMKICQNVCLDETSVKFQYGSCCIKN